MDVDMTNVTGKPLVDGIDELPGILDVITLCDITLLEPGQGLHKLSVGRLVLLGHWAAMCSHAPLLETKVPTAVKHEIIKQHGIHLAAHSCVQSAAKIIGHLENHPVIPVYLLDADSVIFAPLHLDPPNFVRNSNNARLFMNGLVAYINLG
jgi:hypothetical protein